jgi:ADP-ribose pyrophosphatase
LQLKKTFLEFPAGKLDSGETFLQAAHRELKEETGYTSLNFEYLTLIHPGIGYSDEVISIFLARDLVYTQNKPDFDENLIIEEVSPKQLEELLWSNQLTDVKTQIAAFWYLKKNQNSII